MARQARHRMRPLRRAKAKRGANKRFFPLGALGVRRTSSSASKVKGEQQRPAEDKPPPYRNQTRRQEQSQTEILPPRCARGQKDIYKQEPSGHSNTTPAGWKPAATRGASYPLARKAGRMGARRPSEATRSGPSTTKDKGKAKRRFFPLAVLGVRRTSSSNGKNRPGDCLRLGRGIT
jgi:hypothetical protein